MFLELAQLTRGEISNCGGKFTSGSGDLYGLRREILAPFELPKFDSRKPAARRFVAFANSCTVANQLAAFSFDRVRHDDCCSRSGANEISRLRDLPFAEKPLMLKQLPRYTLKQTSVNE